MTDEQERAPPRETQAEDNPRIYVASLSDYNAGRLYGRWLDATVGEDALAAGTSEMLGASREPGAEEWAIHDHEGFGPLHLSEYESLGTVALLGTGIARHGEAFAAWAAHAGTVPAALDGFDDAYLGQWPSIDHYAEQLLDDLGAASVLEAVPLWLQPYLELDVAGFARDLEIGGDVWTATTATGGVHIFDGRV